MQYAQMKILGSAFSAYPLRVNVNLSHTMCYNASGALSDAF